MDYEVEKRLFTMLRSEEELALSAARIFTIPGVLSNNHKKYNRKGIHMIRTPL